MCSVKINWVILIVFIFVVYGIIKLWHFVMKGDQKNLLRLMKNHLGIIANQKIGTEQRLTEYGIGD